MKITRIIHPIGQGGFYSETLKEGGQEITVVYDCGGNSKPFMENYLENYFPKIDEKPTNNNQEQSESEKTIDAVFISHMHEDHVNGLNYLLNQFHVKYLILPELEEDEKLEAFLYNYFKSPESVGNQLMRDIYNRDFSYYLNSRTRIILVQHHNSDLNEAPNDDGDSTKIEFDDNRDLNLADEENTKVYLLSTDAKVHFDRRWVYIPFNPPVKPKPEQKGSFIDFFKNQLSLRKVTIENLPAIIKAKGIRKCKKVYTDYFGNDHNSYSMTLFSGVVTVDDTLRFINSTMENIYNKRYSFLPPYYCCLNPNCLYMGDFETKKHMKSLKRYYNPIWNIIGQVQVPHHGSSYNHLNDLYKFAQFGFISVGEGNKYHHPNIETLMGIKEMGCEPFIVNENMSTIKVFHATKD